MSKYMYVYYSLNEYLTNPNVQALAITAAANGGNPRLNDSKRKSSIIFNLVGQTLLTHDHWLVLLSSDDVEIEGGRLYSPVVSADVLDELVPEGWTGSSKLVDEVETQKTWAEYTQVVEVDGGYCLRYCSTPLNAQSNLIWPADKTVITQWIAQFGGFLTMSEVEAIKVVPEPVE